MVRHKNVHRSVTKRLNSDWTEEVNFFENYDDFRIEFSLYAFKIQTHVRGRRWSKYRSKTPNRSQITGCSTYNFSTLPPWTACVLIRRRRNQKWPKMKWSSLPKRNEQKCSNLPPRRVGLRSSAFIIEHSMQSPLRTHTLFPRCANELTHFEIDEYYRPYMWVQHASKWPFELYEEDCNEKALT